VVCSTNNRAWKRDGYAKSFLRSILLQNFVVHGMTSVVKLLCVVVKLLCVVVKLLFVSLVK
jgi:hypothetical protein